MRSSLPRARLRRRRQHASAGSADAARDGVDCAHLDDGDADRFRGDVHDRHRDGDGLGGRIDETGGERVGFDEARDERGVFGEARGERSVLREEVM